jgi:ubiquinone/menaquinone biosynthesis C-methylase UbiE
MRSPNAPDYLLGHASHEQQRLIEQARFIGNLTAQLFRAAGLREGMQVLDVGCGVGDTSFLAASLVGSSGRVIGIDASHEAIATATQRAAAAGLTNVSFIACALDDIDPALRVDALLGRFILVYLADPAAALNKLLRHLRPGGLVVFQDIDGHSGRSEPPCPLYETMLARLRQTFARSGLDIATGPHLGRIFERAGLPPPELMCGTRIERGAQRGVCDWIAGITRTVLPAMERFGIATADEIDIDSLSERLHAQALQLDATLTLFSFIGAWSRCRENTGDWS